MVIILTESIVMVLSITFGIVVVEVAIDEFCNELELLSIVVEVKTVLLKVENGVVD